MIRFTKHFFLGDPVTGSGDIPFTKKSSFHYSIHSSIISRQSKSSVLLSTCHLWYSSKHRLWRSCAISTKPPPGTMTAITKASTTGNNTISLKLMQCWWSDFLTKLWERNANPWRQSAKKLLRFWMNQDHEAATTGFESAHQQWFVSQYSHDNHHRRQNGHRSWLTGTNFDQGCGSGRYRYR